MSVRDWPAHNKIKENINKIRNTKAPRKKPKVILRKRDDAAIFEDIKTITDGGIMDMISADRADEYDRWIDLGWILYNIGEGCEEALSLWVEFSKKSSKFVSGDCEDQWGKMVLKGKTIASLFAIAKNDSPREYFEWKKTQMNFHLHNALQTERPNEHDVAMIVHHLYKDRFVCVDAKKDVWYEFRNHKWNLLDDGLSLRKLFCGDVRDYFDAYKLEIVRRQREANDVDRARLELQETRCIKMTTALKEVNFHDKVMKMSKLFFYDATFLKLMDENRSLFGCDNGVLDLGMNIFREGRPDDYITLSSNVVYNPGYTNGDDDITAVHDFLNKIFPNKNLKEYFLDSICACLEGGNLNKTFIIHTGEPDGGKSMTMAFVEKAFGEYCIKFPRELFVLSGKTSSGGARPELARIRGKRLALGQEVTQMETFNIGVVKELTGNDSFFVRNLFEKGTDIKPMFTLMMQCNKPPKVPGNDEGTWARTRLLPYESKFVKTREEEKFPVPATEEERIKLKRWKADPNLQDKLDELPAALLWVLFNRFSDYKKRGLRDPPEVHSATTHYRQLNDIFMQYTSERLGVEEDAFLRLTEVTSDFNDWFKENNASYAKEKFTKIAIGAEISKKLGVPLTKKGVSQGWVGYKIVIEEFEDPNARTLMNMAQAIKK
jgi:phage/plasmid-associated DNA primase